MDTLNITWSMPIGTQEKDTAPENPLSRAIAQLLHQGKPFPRLSMCFFDPGNQVPRWLGVLVHSAGDRILFFPGYASSHNGIRRFFQSKEVFNQSFQFDHVSLERDMKTWHATAFGSTAHVGKTRTLELGESRVLWFGLSIAGDHILRLLSRETIVTAKVPAVDSKRRIDTFKAAREGAQFPLISLNTDTPRYTDQTFLHFAFIVGPRGFNDYIGSDLGLPVNSPFLASSLPDMFSSLALRSHRVELSPTTDLQIVCLELPGALNVPLTFTSQTKM